MGHTELAYRMYGVGIEVEGIAVHTDLVGSGAHRRMLLRVNSRVGRRRCHRSGGKVTWHVAREEMR